MAYKAARPRSEKAQKAAAMAAKESAKRIRRVEARCTNAMSFGKFDGDDFTLRADEAHGPNYDHGQERMRQTTPIRVIVSSPCHLRISCFEDLWLWCGLEEFSCP